MKASNQLLREQILKIYTLPRIEVTKNLKKLLVENYPALEFSAHHAKKNTNGNYMYGENENTIVIHIKRKREKNFFTAASQAIRVEKLLEVIKGVEKKTWEFNIYQILHNI